MSKKEEFQRCLSGIRCDEKECKRLRDYWGYAACYEFTVVIDGDAYIFTITNPVAKVYGF